MVNGHSILQEPIKKLDLGVKIDTPTTGPVSLVGQILANQSGANDGVRRIELSVMITGINTVTFLNLDSVIHREIRIKL
jgi:hypothetical protein